MAAKRKAQKSKDSVLEIFIPKIEIHTTHLCIMGISPLLTHPMSQKSLEEIEATSSKKAKGPKEPKDLDREFHENRYFDELGNRVIPCRALKIAAVDAVRNLGTKDLSMTKAKTLFFLLGLWAMHYGPDPDPHVTWCRTSTGRTFISCRPKFWPWRSEFDVQHNASIISTAQIAQLFDLAGFHIGILDDRPSSPFNHGGTFGRFRICNQDELDELKAKYNGKDKTAF